MDLSEISRLFEQGQSETVAFELENAPATHLAETFAALANSQGGTVFLGIEPQSETIKGVRDVEALREKALAAGLRCEPPLVLPRPQVAALDGKQVLVVEVPAGLPHAYALRGKYMERDGKKNRALGPRQLRQLLRERGESNFEAQVVPNATLDDLDRERVSAYAKSFLPQEAQRVRWASCGKKDLAYALTRSRSRSSRVALGTIWASKLLSPRSRKSCRSWRGPSARFFLPSRAMYLPRSA